MAVNDSAAISQGTIVLSTLYRIMQIGSMQNQLTRKCLQDGWWIWLQGTPREVRHLRLTTSSMSLNSHDHPATLSGDRIPNPIARAR